MTVAPTAMMLKVNEDRFSDTSESTASGPRTPPSEPPMSPDMSKLTRALLKPQARTLSSSTRSSSTSTMSPPGLSLETESLPSPMSRESFMSLDSATDSRSSTVSVLNMDLADMLEPPIDLTTLKAPPPAPKYLAPSVAAPSLPPPPTLPPGVPEPPTAPPRLPVAPPLMPWAAPSGLPGLASPPAAFGFSPPPGFPQASPGTPEGLDPGAAFLLDASQRGQVAPYPAPTTKVPSVSQPPAPFMPPAEDIGHFPSLSLFGQAAPGCGQACPVPPLPGVAPPPPPSPPAHAEDFKGDVNQALALLNFLWTGPLVPPLPPSGCYGGVFVSSAISDGLGTEAAEAAEAAARELGERPVKVLLPWYPTPPQAGVDQTKPAKVTPTFLDLQPLA